MASSNRQLCTKCPKTFGHAVCSGCQQSLCTKHYIEHRQEIGKRMDEEVVDVLNDLRNQSKSNKNDQHSLISKIDEWEKRSIEQIQMWAEQARNNLHQHLITTEKHFQDSLGQIYEEIRVSRESEDYTEIEVDKWLAKLQKLKNELENPSTVQLQVPEEAQASVRPIQVKLLTTNRFRPTLDVNARWKRNGVIVAGGNLWGGGMNQLRNPFGFDIDDEITIFVADYNNHRIVKWKVGATSGERIIGSEGCGDGTNQLNGPTNVIIDQINYSLIVSEWGNQRVMRWSLQNPQHGEILVSNVKSYGIAMDDESALYVCDWDRNEVRRYSSGDKQGIIVAGGNGQGNGLNQFSNPYDVCVDKDGSLYVSDHDNHRVMKWMKDAKEGVIVAGGQGQGSDLTSLSRPGGIFVDEMGSVYVSECGNHRVTRWLMDGKSCQVVVGGKGQGAESHQLSSPLILRFDLNGNLYVAEYNNHRIQRFEIE